MGSFMAFSPELTPLSTPPTAPCPGSRGAINSIPYATGRPRENGKPQAKNEGARGPGSSNTELLELKSGSALAMRKFTVPVAPLAPMFSADGESVEEER